MRTRKPPYLLVGILAVALGAVVFMNASAAKPAADEHAEEIKPTPVATDPKGSVLESMKNAAVKDGTSMRPLVKPVKLPASDPKLSMPVRAPVKPRREKSELSSQWYAPESGAGQ